MTTCFFPSVQFSDLKKKKISWSCSDHTWCPNALLKHLKLHFPYVCLKTLISDKLLLHHLGVAQETL